jgi:Ca-activated chloride channel family protein
MALAPVAHACERRDVLLILDSSESMARNSGSGPPRMSVARRAVQEAIDIFPDDAGIALRLYGAQAGAGVRNCEDSVLAVSFAPAATNRIKITEALSRVRARGLTPIQYALDEAEGDFPEDAMRTIILVSDGRESCGGDPCATAARLATRGFVINTVGFQVDRVGRSQLMCIAKASGGQYFDVPVAVGLADKLREALGNCVVADTGTRHRRPS